MSDNNAEFDSKSFLKGLTKRPGVYRMLNTDGEILYVGKARSLKSRVSSYFQKNPSSLKTRALMRQADKVEVTVTHTETEALLLEYNLIKQHRPRFNVLLRDDKSFPFIRLESAHAFPRIAFYRGPRKTKGRLFGPYPSAHSVRETLNYLQKLFTLRPCEDTFFANRSRPCLQYQIKRCSGPCVGLIEPEEYRRDVDDAILFLEGKNKAVVNGLAQRMENASEDLDFERAAHYRDQIASLKAVQEKQFISGYAGDFDVVGAVSEGNTHCVAVLFIRSGRNLGSKTYFPRTAPGSDDEEVMSAFLAQHYLAREAPGEILISQSVPDVEVLQTTLSDRAGRKVQIRHNVRGRRLRWRDMCVTNARHALELRLASSASRRKQLEALRDVLELDEQPSRMECFDISHTGGESTSASCVVFGPDGAIKSDYRRFNIENVTPGDDYGAMRQALTRRYTRIKKGEAPIPDILFVDGGKGQVSEAAKVLDELQLSEVTLVGVAKGPGRRPGMEQLFLSGKKRPLILPADSPALLLIQQIRDEAHRFAIGGHRQRRAKTRRVSVLESIPGLGPKRRRNLLQQFGGLQRVTRAGVEDLAAVKGISRKLAEQIYTRFHSEG